MNTLSISASAYSNSPFPNPQRPLLQNRKTLILSNHMLALKFTPFTLNLRRRKTFICAANQDAEEAFKKMVEIDRLIDMLREANPRELQKLVVENILAFNPGFWIRLAARSDTCKSEDDKKDYEELAATVMNVVDLVVHKTSEKIESATDVLKGVLKPVVSDEGEIHWPPRDPQAFTLMEKEINQREQEGQLDEGFLAEVNAQLRQDFSRIKRVPISTLPIICFRDGSPPLPDALNTSLTQSAISGINGLDVEQCFPMQKNITMKLTNDQISPGVWYIGLFNGIGPTRTQSKMIIRGLAYSFVANITVEACTNSMMRGNFCNSPVYPLSCTASDVNNALEARVNKPILENLVSCKSNLETFCVHAGVPNLFSLDIMNVAEEFTIMATNVKFNITPSNKTFGSNDIGLLCLVRHGAMPSVTSHDYSSDLSKSPLVINSPLTGRWYISIVPVNLTKPQDGIVTICYSVESQVLQCPLGKAGPNCTMDIYTLQTFVRKGPTPFESYYLPVGAGASHGSANFPLEPLLRKSSYDGEPGDIWTYFLVDIPRGAAGGNIHIQLSSDVKITYEVYARFGGLPSLVSWDYYYVNKTKRSDTSMFFMVYDSSDNKINFYIMYAREGTWGFGLRHLNTSSDTAKGLTTMSLSLERCPKRCSSHGDCKFSFDASGLTSYSFCSCDRNHGGFDCSIEIVTHQGHVRQSLFLIISNAAAILPAYWALRQKALAEWVLFTSSGISSGLYHACDVGTWCALSYNVLQFMDFWLSFMAVISTFLYLATIDEVLKRAIHTAIAILTALMAATKATRSSNVVLVIVIGVLGLLIGWVIEISTKYRSLSFSIRFSLNFSQSLGMIKRWLCNLVRGLLRRYHWPFALAGFALLAMAGVSWTLETSENYWFWHSFWHITIYTSSFFFLCSKANVVDIENQPDTNGNYELTHQDSIPRSG